jgi:argininosuccinate lyase
MASNQMWGGRFAGGPAEIMQAFTPSIDFDRRMAAEDIKGSCAHARMLVQEGIIPAEDADAILKGLAEIATEIAEGRFVFKRELEDIHLNIESRLTELIGPAAGRLHTARSRNDQVATDFRLWVRGACGRSEDALITLMRALHEKAAGNIDTVMPGFTHMQAAQPISFAHHLLAYVEMFSRDVLRFRDAAKRMNECPLGAAALAGTPYAIDREFTARQLGFDKPMRNSLDAVSARDFALEYLAAATIAATHLSKLAGEIVQWCSPGFGFVTLSDAFSTGSSIMPQKRNPDAAELARGKAGRVLGDFTALAAVVKGLVLAYGSDLQEDKERVFDAADTLELTLAVMAGMIRDMTPNKEKMRAAASAGFPTATDLADWLVQTLKKPFREAHHIAGAIVKCAEDRHCDLEHVPLADMQAIEPAITEAVYKVLGLDASLAARMSYGGTAPNRIKEQIAFWRDKLR